jgi:excisionase family DNA binding protein
MSFLTVPEVAQQLAVSRGLIYKLIDKGDLHAVKIASSVRIPKYALDAYLEKITSTPTRRQIAANHKSSRA